MKIGLVTYFRENYGSALQCFATKHYLEKVGYDIQVMERSETLCERTLLRIYHLIKHGIKAIRYKGYAQHYVEIRKVIKSEKSFLSDKAKKEIDVFIDEYIQPARVSWKEMCFFSKQNDCVGVICGSDQIWNPSIGIIDPIYFLKFCPRKKRITLSPSFGISHIPEYNVNDVKKGLRGFEQISLREESGIEMALKLVGKCCTRVADPVFLLNKTEWSNLIKKRRVYQADYAFIYFLNEPSSSAMRAINEICKKYLYTPICYAHRHNKYREIKRGSYLDGDPLDFINYIAHAQIIFTDSFHAVCFSLIFEKQYVCFQRQHLHQSSQSNRIESLLNRFEMSSYYITCDQEMKDILPYDMELLRDNIRRENRLVTRYLTEEIYRVSGKKNENLCI